MTAIGGFIRVGGSRPERSEVERLQNALAIYGLDAKDSKVVGNVAMVRALLRSTPEDFFDEQPLVTSSQELMLVLDGRIDNRDDLIDSLGPNANFWRDESDSRLLSAALLRWGRSAIEKVVGDFAFAAWWFGRGELWLARDALAQRPLYWSTKDGVFAFASMPKGILALSGFTKALSKEALMSFMLSSPDDSNRSFFDGIFRVLPGELVVYDGSSVKRDLFYDFKSISRPIKFKSDDQYVEAFLELFDNAVDCRLRSSKPISAQLSSGMDSSAVVATAAKLLSAKGKKIKAFTAAPREDFDGPVPPFSHADESLAASSLGRMYPNIDHRVIRTSAENHFLEDLDEVVEILDRPPLNICNLSWVRHIEREARSGGSVVMLTGTGGNASISYTGKQYLPMLISRCRILRWWKEAKALLRENANCSKRSIALDSVGPFLPVFLWNVVAKRYGAFWALDHFCPASPEFLSEMKEKEGVAGKGWDPSFRPWGNSFQMRLHMLKRADVGDYIACSKAAGIDVRDPTADRRVVEYCLRVPDSQYLRNGKMQWMLKRAMNSRLPPEYLTSTSKGYQAADWYESLESSMIEANRRIEGITGRNASNYLNLSEMQAALDEWPGAANWDQPAKFERKYRLKLLRGMSVGAFAERVERGNKR